jgi:membrane protein required for colicin V production
MITVLDILIVIPLAWAAWKGWKNGFVMELFSILALFAGLYVAVRFSNGLTHWLRNSMDMQATYLPVVVFVVLFALVAVGLWFLGKKIDENVNGASGETLNKAGGSLFGIGRMVLYLSLFFIFFAAIDERYKLLPENQRANSLLFNPIYKFSTTVLPPVRESEFYKKLQEKANPSATAEVVEETD